MVVTHEKVVALGISQLIDELKTAKVVGIISHGEDLLTRIAELKPNLIMLDTDLPNRNVFSIAEEINRSYPMIHKAFLSRTVTMIKMDMTIRTHSSGFFLKTDTAEDIVFGLRKILQGDRYFTQEALQYLGFKSSHEIPELMGKSDLLQLTTRQLEVLKYLAEGHSVKEVAKRMHLSEKSVDSHKYRIMHRLGIHDRVELALYALREGLISL
jgi:DNA-binding NarL/FixJ family response regulator